VEELLEVLDEEHLEGLDARVDGPHRSTGGAHTNPWDQDYRTAAQQDADRVIYSSAFQRLAYVTQVTAPESGHVFHNRLEHSLKVARVGRSNVQRLRTIAKGGHLAGEALRMLSALDPDSTEASCLAHDLGHPPFGHIAEQVLQSVVSEHVGTDGGFEGNAQSFRIVTWLAQRASGAGLNLTRRTLDGMLKYPWHWRQEDALGKRENKWGYYRGDSEAFEFARRHYPPEADTELPKRSLGACIMDWADDLTYAVHDLDDFFRAGLIPLHRLAHDRDDEFKRLTDALRELKSTAPRSWPDYDVDELLSAIQDVAAGVAPTGAYIHTRDMRRDMRRLGSELISRYLSAFVIENDASGRALVKVERAIEREVEALKMLVRLYVVERPGLAVVQHGQQRVIRDLFKIYFDASNANPRDGGDRRVFPQQVKRLLADGSNDPPSRARLVSDMISGLTEASAIQLHRRLIGGWSAPTLDATAQMA
jgi:dGTPase